MEGDIGMYHEKEVITWDLSSIEEGELEVVTNSVGYEEEEDELDELEEDEENDDFVDDEEVIVEEDDDNDDELIDAEETE